MNAMLDPSPPSARRRRRASRRGLAVAATLLSLAPLTLGGCGVSLMGHRIGMPASDRRLSESALQKNLRETREAAQLAPQESYWPFHVAELYVAADSGARAEAALEQALARDPDYAPALALRSSLDYRAGRHEHAIQFLEAALAKPGAFPGGPPSALFEGLALHYDALGREDDARRTVEKARAGRKERPSPALVYLTLRGPTPESAAAAAESAWRNDPGSAVNQNNYGIARLRQGDPAGARKAFEKATQIDPALAGPYYNLAILQKYYLFDDQAASHWFDLYWARSQSDPDGLAVTFGKSDRRNLAQDGD